MIEHHFSSGVYAKESRIPANYVLVQHKHKYDHLSILASGSVELMVDGVRSVIYAPACLTIQAGKHHGIKSLTEVVWYCIHAVDASEKILDSDEIEIQSLATSLQE